MDSFLLMFGAIHLVAYCLTGAFVLLTIGTVKIHMWFRVMGRIIQWHHARALWKAGRRDREPRP